ncbi:hypothetical protein [Janthinobacterium sp. 17J80-10]|uniref:hypothetical protein n=1 Tax=Janthinobacterium sp. 17J80-10 TaxID=2497863 RepID=UPI001005539C|nr:hypothetical protein [Janthinobacterium sp. 17J80-10]QAU32891.1 hypothetical protein EKL02_01165 [Janthinobacterium sp. 17J80-10]
MARILSCYYLDDPLSDDERRLVEQSLLGPWAKFRTGAVLLIERRVPAVLPLPDATGQFGGTPEQRATRIRSHLRHAGIMDDAGQQVVWVMPQDREWDAVFQFAIRESTGFGPYVVQRWFERDIARQRGSARIVDTQMLLDGLGRD